MKHFRLGAIMCLLGLVLCSQLALAQGSYLYGLTRDGKLILIDKSTGEGNLIITLSSSYQFDSVEYASPYFYASYQGGGILKFDFSGLVADLGDSGYGVVEALSRRPDGNVYAAFSVSTGFEIYNDDGRSESIGLLNLTTGNISIVADPPQAGTAGIGYSFESLVYLDNTNFYVFHSDGGAWDKAYGSIFPMTANHDYFDDGSVAYGSDVDWGILTGLAKDPDTGYIYGVDGFEPVVGEDYRVMIPSSLYLIDYDTPSIAEEALGDTGYDGLVGLTFGPQEPQGCDIGHHIIPAGNISDTRDFGYFDYISNSSNTVTVTSTGNVTLRTPEYVQLNGGFTVQNGGVLTITVNGGACA